VTKKATIYESYSFEAVLNVGLDASINNMQILKGIREKAGVINSRMNFLLAQVYRYADESTNKMLLSVAVALDGGLDWILDLLTTLIHKY
jgi:hypothetical protein